MKRLALLAAAAPVALAALAASAPKGVFRDVTKSSGIDMRVESDLMRLKLIATMGGGCAAGDYDGDGIDDLAVAAWYDPTGGDQAGAVYVFGGSR